VNKKYLKIKLKAKKLKIKPKKESEAITEKNINLFFKIYFN